MIVPAWFYHGKTCNIHTHNASIKLSPQSNVAIPGHRVNTDVAGDNWATELVCHYDKSVVITSKDLCK